MAASPASCRQRIGGRSTRRRPRPPVAAAQALEGCRCCCSCCCWRPRLTHQAQGCGPSTPSRPSENAKQGAACRRRDRAAPSSRRPQRQGPFELLHRLRSDLYIRHYLPLFIIDAATLVDSTVPRRARTLCRGRAPRLCAPLVARPARPARDDSSEPGESCWNAREATAAAWHHTRRWRGVTR
jgi:hypothetical protein